MNHETCKKPLVHNGATKNKKNRHAISLIVPDNDSANGRDFTLPPHPRPRSTNLFTEDDKKYRCLFEQLPWFAFSCDMEGEFIDINRALKALFDHYGWHLNGLTLYDIVHPNHEEDLKTILRDVKTDLLKDGVMELLTPGGMNFFVEYTILFVKNDTGPYGIIGTARDITEHLYTHLRLKESENHYSSIFENSGTGVFIVDDELTIISVNTYAANMIGYPKLEIEGVMNWSSVFHNEKQKKDLINQHLNQFEADLTDRLGFKHNLVVTVSEIPDTQNFIISTTDVTKLKHVETALKTLCCQLEQTIHERTKELTEANSLLENQINNRISVEQQLRKSEKKYRYLLNDIGPVLILNDDMTIAEVNKQFEAKSGYSKEEIEGKRQWYEFVHKDDLPDIMAIWQMKNISLPNYVELQVRVKKKNGDYRNAFVRASKIPDSRQVALILFDITQFKNTHKALYESKRKLSTLMDNIPGMAYIASEDAKKTLTFVSEGSIGLTGYAPDNFTTGPADFYNSMVHRDDLGRVIHHIHDSLKKKQPFQTSYRITTSDNLEKWVLEKGIGVYSSDGELLSVEGIIIDAHDHISEMKHLQKENDRLKIAAGDRYKFGDILGKSTAMHTVYELILKASALETNIIIYGESGTGKELVSKAIKDLSNRHDKPFVVVNCGAIPETLFESEMFGYKKGAFSGATDNKKGVFAQAEGGILFMDEIGDIPLNMQVKLLRVIEGGGYLPVGSTHACYPDVRIIFATNKNLEQAIKDGTMRHDFYYRIHIYPVNLPPLRDRAEDIPLLIDYFLQKFSTGAIPVIKPDDIEALKSYQWKGNVRELQHVILRYLAEGSLTFMEKEIPALGKKVPAIDSQSTSDNRDLRSIMSEVEKRLIHERLKKNHWNKTQTAVDLHIDRKTLLTKIKTYELTDPGR